MVYREGAAAPAAVPAEQGQVPKEQAAIPAGSFGAGPVPVDGLVVDEASLTGESDPVKKGPNDDPWVRSGTQVIEGSGRMLVTAVGEHTEWGRIMALVVGEVGDTPLQEKLGWLATAIGKLGFIVAVICFFVLLIRWIIDNKGFPMSNIAEGPLEFFIFAVTILVVAVPKGLPLAVTISLAYSMKKMMKDNNFVRVLAACETMGGATAICSDKTGTLTENRMTVTKGYFCGQLYSEVPPLSRLPTEAAEEIVLNAALNSKAFLMADPTNDKKIEFVGNRTECALLVMVKNWGQDYKQLRGLHHDSTLEVYGFSSERKMASVLVKRNGKLRLYNKGAAEMVLSRCISMVDTNGQAVPMTEAKREELLGIVTGMASTGLRTLCLAYTDFPESDPSRPDDFFSTPHEDNLTALCIVGIKDPVRKEVPDAVTTCQRAGITVRMVTGDNIHTAKHIARECGILTDDGLALEGPVFRNMPEEELLPLLPRLQVLARSSPCDKYILVQTLKKLGEVVAVTGDGTNDAPALKESDVGLAMGIAGTEVAKEAADIVIMDDNFSSIVKAVLCGRSVFTNIRNFLQFQLTINLVALVVAFVAAITNGETPLNVLQLLWVNLIMDSLAALALATEAPTLYLLTKKPHGRDEPLISKYKWKFIFTAGSYQCFWLFLIFYSMRGAQLDAFKVPSQCTYFKGTYDGKRGYDGGHWQTNEADVMPCQLNSVGAAGLPGGQGGLLKASFQRTGVRRRAAGARRGAFRAHCLLGLLGLLLLPMLLLGAAAQLNNMPDCPVALSNTDDTCHADDPCHAYYPCHADDQPTCSSSGGADLCGSIDNYIGGMAHGVEQPPGSGATVPGPAADASISPKRRPPGFMPHVKRPRHRR